ncbi:MAG TPA: AIR synthase-related protein, partial [Nitrolancea sp.]|nr:AIR synthase-related protein [Nitrolancea sp.]
LHTNGFTLARSALNLDGDPAAVRRLLSERPFDSTDTLGELLLRPHRSYLPAVLPLLERELVTGMAHITGGGIVGNVGRIIPNGLVAEIDVDAWAPTQIFDLIQERGSIRASEMFRVFNMGVGFVTIVRPDDADESLATMSDARVIGRVASTNDRTRVRLNGLKDG